MRYLKSYKKFETIGHTELTDEMWQDMSDILLELQDEGFLISKDIADSKKVGYKLCHDVVEIVVDNHSKQGFSFNKIEEPIRRLIDYMSQLKWNYSLMYFGKFSFVEFEYDGNDPLIKKLRFNYEHEEILHKSLVDKILNNCTAFKVVFYKEIIRPLW